MNLLKINLLEPAKRLGQGLALLSAVFLFQANYVFGAEFVGDAQMQARDLLSGTVGGRAKTVDASPAIPADGHRTPSLDPQEQARQLILGKPDSGGNKGRAVALEPTVNATPAASTQGNHRTYPDPQESARRMILGHGASDTAAAALKRSVSLTQDPLVMRLDKDEFRIAFGINADGLGSNGGNGVIRYRVDWKAEDGTARSEIKRVSYTVLPGTSRTITVDHQYFDTAAGEHTTDVVKVSVDQITYLDSPAFLTASIAVQAAPSSVVQGHR
jgi:hypothetical protein